MRQNGTKKETISAEFARQIIRDAQDPQSGEPWKAALILFTYINETVDHALNISTYRTGSDWHGEITMTLEDRFNHIANDWPARPNNPFTLSLKELGNIIIFEQESDTAYWPEKTLRFSDVGYFNGVRIALQSPVVTGLYKRILAVLGRYRECEKCHQKAFTVPLHWHTNPYPQFGGHYDACLNCGYIGTGTVCYVGLDYGWILNKTFVNEGFAQDFTIHVGTLQTHLQYLSLFLGNYWVQDMKYLIQKEVFDLCEVPISPHQFDLYLTENQLHEMEKLSEIEGRELLLKVNPGSKLNEMKICSIMKNVADNWNW